MKLFISTRIVGAIIMIAASIQPTYASQPMSWSWWKGEGGSLTINGQYIEIFEKLAIARSADEVCAVYLSGIGSDGALTLYLGNQGKTLAPLELAYIGTNKPETVTSPIRKRTLYFGPTLIVDRYIPFANQELRSSLLEPDDKPAPPDMIVKLENVCAEEMAARKAKKSAP